MNRNLSPRVSTVLIAGAILGPTAATPIGGQEVALGARSAAHAESFGLIGGLRELASGEVLVADPLGGLLVRLDATLRTAATIGSEGEGPGEYRQPDAVWPIGADSSLLVDLGNARLTVIGPDGRLGETTPIVLPGGGGGGMGGMMMAIPGGTDAAGHVYFTGSAVSPAGIRDSVTLYRLDRATGDLSEVASVRAPAMSRQTSGGGNNQSVRVTSIPLATADTWGVAPDGGVFIAREGDYSVQYVPPSGATRQGDPVAYDPVRIGADERQEWSDEQARSGGVGVAVQEVNGRRQVTMSRGRGAAGSGNLDELPWPAAKPPFANARIRVDAAGHGWVRRNLRAGRAALYDVFDQNGRHVRSVRFPEGRTLVGFGASAIYVAYTDALDQQFLEKYPMP
jgi:hypothetical protein